MVLINIYLNTPLYLLSQFDVSSRISENGLKCSLRGEHVVKENMCVCVWGGGGGGGGGGGLGPWPCHGRTRPGLRGIIEQTDAVGRRGMGSKTCMSPTVGHRQRISARS